MLFNYDVCKVEKIVDGDTIDVVIDLGFGLFTKQRLRLTGINTPELTSKIQEERDLANKAKQYLIDVLLLRKVRVITSKTEKYGRYLAKVYIKNELDNDFCINDSLIDLGYARPYMTSE